MIALFSLVFVQNEEYFFEEQNENCHEIDEMNEPSLVFLFQKEIDSF